MTTDSQAATPAVVLLVDETTAMQEAVRDGKKSRSEAVATAVNSLLKQLAAGPPCSVALLAYTQHDDNNEVKLASRWAGELAGDFLVTSDRYVDLPQTVEQRTRRIPDASGFGVEREETIEFPVWYQCQTSESEADGTQWESGLPLTARTLVVHITSGGLPSQSLAENAKKWASPEPAYFHIEIGSSSGAPAICFPANPDFLPEGEATAWFDCTSPLGPATLDALRSRSLAVNTGARGLILQGGLKELLDAFAAARAWVTDTEPVPTIAHEATTPPETTPVASPIVMPAPPPPSTSQIVEPEPAVEIESSVDPESAPPASEIQQVEIEQEVPESPKVVEAPAPPESPPPVVAPDPPAPVAAERETPAMLPTEPEPVEPVPVEIKPVESEPEPPVRRGLIMLVIDRSLQDPVAPPTNDVFTRIKQQANDLLAEISKTADGWLDVGMVTYGRMSSGSVEVSTRFFGGLTDHSIATDRQLAAGAIRTEIYEEQMPNGIGGIISVERKRPMFIELPSTEQSSCVDAFQAVAPLVGGWCSRNRGQCAAPLIIHMTRGAMSQRDLRAGLKKLKDVRSTAGPPLVHHLVLTESPGPAAAFPVDCSETGPSELRFFCQLSSPHVAAEYLAAKHQQIQPDSRGIVVNGTFDLAVEGFRHTLSGSATETS